MDEISGIRNDLTVTFFMPVVLAKMVLLCVIDSPAVFCVDLRYLRNIRTAVADENNIVGIDCMHCLYDIKYIVCDPDTAVIIRCFG